MPDDLYQKLPKICKIEFGTANVHSFPIDNDVTQTLDFLLSWCNSVFEVKNFCYICVIKKEESFEQANIGLTRLCGIKFDMSPQKWGDLMLESYRTHNDGKVPEYVSKLIRSPMREFPEVIILQTAVLFESVLRSFFYRVCHGFKLIKRDDYFGSILTTFELISSFGGS